MSIFQFPSFAGSGSKLSYGSSLMRNQGKFSSGLQNHSPPHFYSQLNRTRSHDKTNFFPSSTGSFDQKFTQTNYTRPSPYSHYDFIKPSSISRMNFQLNSQLKPQLNKPSSPVNQPHQAFLTRHKSFQKPVTLKTGQLRAQSGLDRLLQRKKQLDRRVKEILQNVPEMKIEETKRTTVREQTKASEVESKGRQTRKFSGLDDLKLSSQLGQTMLRK